MKAIVFDTPGDFKEVLFSREVPAPSMSDSQIRVKVKARPVNPSDTYLIKGTYRHKPDCPQIAGLTGSGIVTGAGRSASACKVGNHVAFRAMGTWAEEIVLDT